MQTFKYKLLSADGRQLSGTVEAEDQQQAAGLIARPGSEIVKIKKVSSVLNRDIGGPKKVKSAELMVFCRQLAAFIRAGVPMLEALESIGSEDASKVMQQTLRSVQFDLERGDPISVSMTRHPEMFPQFFVDLVRAGEVTGNLDAVLTHAASHIERNEEAKRKIKSALAYPAVIGVVAIGTVAALVGFVLPRFVVFFKELGAKLPLPTRMLLGFSGFLSRWWYLFLGGFVLVAVAIFLALRTEAGQAAKDKLLLKTPGLGPVVRYAILERFCRTLSTMVAAGVPLMETFQVVIDGTNNSVYQKGLVVVREQMLVGSGISGPIAQTGLFPHIVPQMIRVGEDTGTLDVQLESAAEFFGTELDYKIKQFTTYFEPAVLILMGGIVGFVAIALISAMYGIFNQAGSLGG